MMLGKIIAATRKLAWLKLISMMIVFYGAVISVSASAQPAVGQPNSDGGVQLYYQKVEIYSNNWRGMAVNRGDTGQIDIYINGEGKTVSFNGILSLNCVSTSSTAYVWKAASNFSTSLLCKSVTQNATDIHDVVPQIVVDNARKIFCPKVKRLLTKH